MSDYELWREYHRRYFKNGLATLLVLVIIFSVPLGISYLYCEHLTKKYAGEMIADIRSEVVPDGGAPTCFKVLSYKDGLIPEAKVYVVSQGGREKAVYRLSHRYGQWNIEEYSGSFAWPYSLIPDFDVSISVGP